MARKLKIAQFNKIQKLRKLRNVFSRTMAQAILGTESAVSTVRCPADRRGAGFQPRRKASSESPQGAFRRSPSKGVSGTLDCGVKTRPRWPCHQEINSG